MGKNKSDYCLMANYLTVHQLRQFAERLSFDLESKGHNLNDIRIIFCGFDGVGSGKAEARLVEQSTSKYITITPC